MIIQKQPIKTTLVCGFLGSGKTTFIRDQLQNDQQKTVVLVNEFGPLALDGALMHEVDGLQVVEMAGGCICCTQKLQLADEIIRIVEHFQPQRIFVEPSGVAEASAVIKILKALSHKKLIHFEGVITIVDAETFMEYSAPDVFGSFFLNQVCNADLVLINKKDLVPDDHLQLLIARIQILASSALVFPTTFSQLAAPLPEELERRDQPGHHSVGHQPRWEYVCLEPSVQFSKSNLTEIMELMKQGIFGKILRAKGVVETVREHVEKCLQLQLVGNRGTIEEQESFVSPRLTCIGFNLDRDRLEACFAGQLFSTDMPNLISGIQ